MLAVKRVTKKAYVYVFLAIISLLIWGYFVKSRLKPFFPSRLSFSILEWRKYSSIAPLTDIKLSLWPNECGFRNWNPVGIIFIRSSNSSSTIRSKLREKFAVLDSACGYRVIFEATDLSDSRPIGKFSDGLRQEVAQFDDIFGIGNQEPSTSPVYEKTLEAWMREKCGVKIATAVIVRGLVDNSLQALYKRSSMLVINLSKWHGLWFLKEIFARHKNVWIFISRSQVISTIYNNNWEFFAKIRLETTSPGLYCG